MGADDDKETSGRRRCDSSVADVYGRRPSRRGVTEFRRHKFDLSIRLCLHQRLLCGGTSSDGTTGTNYGITFSSNAQAICLNSTTVTCSNTSRGGLGNPTSQKGGLFFLSGSQTFMDDAAGFTNGFSLEYVSLSQPGSVSVYSGLDGTGTLLASIALSPNAGSCPGYSAGFCPFSPVGVNFSGTAQSIAFGGVANQIVFDDVTFGSATVGGGAPEPSTWAMMLLGVGGVGVAMRARRKRALAAA